MGGYVFDLRNKYQHMQPLKNQYSPHKHRPINYGATQKLVQPTDTIPPLNEKESIDFKALWELYFMWEGKSITNC